MNDLRTLLFTWLTVFWAVAVPASAQVRRNQGTAANTGMP